jgi:hypothetical protein
MSRTRPGRIGLERCGVVVQREAAVVELGEDAGRDERAEHAAELRRAGVDRLREILRSERPGAQRVGHAQLRRDVQRLGELVPLREPHQCPLGRVHAARSLWPGARRDLGAHRRRRGRAVSTGSPAREPA